MNTLARTARTAGGTAMRVTIGSVCKTAAAVAVVGMISVFSIAQLSRAYFAPTVAMDPTQQPQLSSLLCRIDRRCPAMNSPISPHRAAKPAARLARCSAAPIRRLSDAFIVGRCCARN
jgi:hypothetical protein